MPQQLTPDQIEKLKSLGIEINQNNISSPQKNLPSTIDHRRSNFFPLLSISGLTILSFSGLILFKNRTQTPATISTSNYPLPQTSVTPTQVPKSIQHYLLTSQQLFSSATQLQNNSSAPENQRTSELTNLLNQSILAATQAIKEFPTDYRGFFQRGRIYQSVLASQPQLLPQVIADLTQAQKLAPDNAEITRSLASAYAIGGDAQNTINFLSQTIALEPTKAQNFYDLAKIQQQVGLLPQALQTYTQLISLVSDSTQKAQIETEKSSLEKLISQNVKSSEVSTKETQNLPSISPLPSTIYHLPSNLDSPTIQASADTGLIVAAPQEINKVEVANLSTSNSLSGTSILPSGQNQISIQNDQVSSISQIYLTVTKGGKNQNLQVYSKTEKSFTVGLDSPISEDIEFKWWIIN